MAGETFSQRYLPLVTFERADVAADYGQIAWESGLRVLEVGFRTTAAQQAVTQLRSTTQLIVVAGTLTSTEAIDMAIESGAHWGIAPNFDADALDYAARRNFTLVPGIATPTELGAAVKSGHSEVKVYPVSQLGGVHYLSTLRAVFPAVGLIPSGGISLEDVALYLSAPGVTAVSGSWLPSVQAHTTDFDAEGLARIVGELTEATTGDH